MYSKTANITNPYTSDAKSLNASSVLGVTTIGRGHADLEFFCGFMDMLSPVPSSFYSEYTQSLARISITVVGKAQATKSNLHNFWYRCLVVAPIDVSEVLSQTRHACMNYERKKNLKIV